MTVRRWTVKVMLATLLLALPAHADEPPREPGPFRAPDLVEPVALDPTLRLDIRYASTHNFAGRAVYKEARAFLQRPAAEALVRVHRTLAAQGLGLVVLDGYRPWSVTRIFWDITPPAQRPFVADPATGSRHNRGAAVDVTLYERASGREVEMPSPYDDMSERAHPTWDGGSETARAHRDRLRAAMEAEGFFVHPAEWWHYDWKDWRAYPLLDVAFRDLRPGASPASLDLATARVVDLTHPFDERTLYWPGAPSGFELRRLAWGETAAGFFYAANAFCAPEHGGTHLDAPVHFAAGRRTADEIPVGQLVGPAVVVDAGAEAARDLDYRLTARDVRRWETVHGTIPPGAIVLLRTGWDARWPDRRRVFGDDTPGRTTALHFPSYGSDAAGLLVRDRRVAALGVDTPSIDHGPSQDFPVHRLVAAADVPGLENVAHLEQVPETGAWVVALPIKIAGGSGGPARIVALVAR
jgi:kynurenine formamidase/D-alanyl-D-alanine dipeptidase